MDLNRLTKGSSLYLPVVNSVLLVIREMLMQYREMAKSNGTAIETALTPAFQTIVHKDKGAMLDSGLEQRMQKIIM
jgi:acetamidase/formamidase